ncbi:HAD family hydrolase [Streptomyces cinnamoneus]|uniref:HAD family hydrolase n=1 Tax=Streptomyces cinnamoneus TaxID=53446 RepID=UPI0015E38416|nr:HAD family hydrolase [Streptomyces cinnamoneus]
MTGADAVKEVLSRADSVLLDFDGPICHVFAGLPAPSVAQRLRESYTETHGKAAASRLGQTDDPLELVRRAGTKKLPGARRLEAMLTALELEAVNAGEPTPHAREAIQAVHASSRKLAAVSNNSTAALVQYFSEHSLDRYVSPLIGREPEHLTRMKPDPHMVLLALKAHGTAPHRAVVVGDSVTDIQAAHAAGVPCIGYANKPGKAETLKHEGATTVIQDMGELTEAI